MFNSRGIGQRVNRALLLQAAAIAIAAVVGVYLASVVLEDILITQALRKEAEFFWNRHASDPNVALPHTLNLQGFLTGRNDEDAPAKALLALDPGLHRLPEDVQPGTVHVSGNAGQRLYLLFNGEQVDSLTAWFGLVPLAVVLLVLYFSVWLMYRASQRAVSPLTRLAREVNNLDPKAPDSTLFQHPRSLTTADEEVRLLSTALERFAERLNAFIERERNFTRDVSHELRSPLTVIRIASDLLTTQPELLTDQARGAVDKIKRSATEMEELVEAFLLLARESDASLTMHEVCVNTIVDEELQHARMLAAHKPIEVETHADCLLYTTASDKVLSILIGNLIRNAFAYTDAGRISVRIGRQKVIIEDSGVGMNPEQVSELFEPFRRANPERRGGHGVGLTIVKRLSDRFNWPVSIDSRPGTGTRVTIGFADARAEEVPREAPVAAPQSLS